MIKFTINQLNEIEILISNFIIENPYLNIAFGDKVPTKSEQNFVINIVNSEAEKLCIQEGIDKNIKFELQLTVTDNNKMIIKSQWVIAK